MPILNFLSKVDDVRKYISKFVIQNEIDQDKFNVLELEYKTGKLHHAIHDI